MKKRNRSCLIVAVILIVLCIAVVSMSFAMDICPPQGPWPSPPWCDGSEELVLPSIPDRIFPQANTPKLSITVTVPSNTPDHTVVYLELYDEVGVNYMTMAMTARGLHEWTIASTDLDWQLANRGILRYRYTRNNLGFWGAEEFTPDTEDTFRMISSEGAGEIHDTVAKWRWMPETGKVPLEVTAGLVPFELRLNNLSFQQGVVHADWWWDAFEALIPSTNARLVENSISSMELCPPWDYTQVFPTPVISNQVGHAYPDDMLRLHIESLHDSGINVFLGPQICCTAVDTTALTPEWWEAWYEQYKGFLFYHIDIANEYGIEYLGIGGDWLVYAQHPEGFAEKMDAIYNEAEARYNGNMGMLLFLGGNPTDGIHDFYPNPESIPNLDRWDFLSITWWAGISTSNDPTPEELDENVEMIFRTRIQPLYDRYGVPIILNQVSFASVDGGLMGNVDVFDPAIQLWEPYTEKYQLDLEEQALGFDAILRGIARHEYVIGFYPFFYLPDTYPLTLEFNLRDKPAEQILRQWYEVIP